MHLSIVAVFALLINAVVIYAAPPLTPLKKGDPLPDWIDTGCSSMCPTRAGSHENCVEQCQSCWDEWSHSSVGEAAIREGFRVASFSEQDRRSSVNGKIFRKFSEYLEREHKLRSVHMEKRVKLIGKKDPGTAKMTWVKGEERWMEESDSDRKWLGEDSNWKWKKVDNKWVNRFVYKAPTYPST